MNIFAVEYSPSAFSLNEFGTIGLSLDLGKSFSSFLEFVGRSQGHRKHNGQRSGIPAGTRSTMEGEVEFEQPLAIKI